MEYDNGKKIIKEMSKVLPEFKTKPLRPHELRHSQCNSLYSVWWIGAEISEDFIIDWVAIWQ